MQKLLLVITIFLMECKSWGKFYESAKILNIGANGVLNSGFITGTAPTGSVKTVRISIDGGAYADANGTTSWKYKLPTGAATLRENSLHSLKVAIRYSDDSEIESTSINFRKGINKDINGDGFSDYVITAIGRNSSQGAAYVYYTSSGGLPQSPLSANATYTGIAAFDSFGNNVQLGDINGDGFAEVIIMANSRNSTTGEVYVFYPTVAADGNSAALASGVASSAGTILTGEAAGNNFGAGMGVGDLNADGYCDLFVAAMQYGAGQGRTYVFAGQPGKINSGIALAIANSYFTGEAAGDNPQPIFLGDLNGDGLTDLAMGSVNNGGNAGAAYIFYGTGTFPTTQNLSAANAKITGQAAPDNFGGYVHIADLNNDGYGDLIVGASGRNSQTGASYIFYGSGTKLTSRSAATANTIISGISAGDYFSNAFAGDFNNDGYNDLVIGSYLRNAGAGASQGAGYIFLSSANGITVTSALNANATFNGASAGDNFGGHFRIVDVNQDGYADLLAGAFSRNAGAGSSQGSAYIFLSGPGAISSANPANASAIINGQSAGDEFGARTE